MKYVFSLQYTCSAPSLFRFTLFMPVSVLPLKIIEVSARIIDLRGSARLPQQLSTLTFVARLVSEAYGRFTREQIDTPLTQRPASCSGCPWLGFDLETDYPDWGLFAFFFSPSDKCPDITAS
jgi:hypothetical protein